MDDLRRHDEEQFAVALAKDWLDRPGIDPDGDKAVLSRQFLRVRDRLAAAESQREALDVGLLTTALHTADPIIGPDGVGHTPMCETRAALIAAAYERERAALKEQPR